MVRGEPLPIPELPIPELPIPELRAGHRIPPRAPVIGVPGHLYAERDDRYKPSPPPGQGPVLVWFRTSRRNAVRIVVVTPVLMVTFLTLRSAGLGWMGHWWAWLFVTLPTFCYGWFNQGRSYAAGVDWLAIGPRSWVRTRDLVEARIVPGGLTHNLVLTDSGGRRLSASMPSLQVKPELWALVYQGMRYSVQVRPVTTNALTRAVLRASPAPPSWSGLARSRLAQRRQVRAQTRDATGFVLPRVRFPHSHRLPRRNHRRDTSTE